MTVLSVVRPLPRLAARAVGRVAAVAGGTATLAMPVAPSPRLVLAGHGLACEWRQSASVPAAPVASTAWRAAAKP